MSGTGKNDATCRFLRRVGACVVRSRLKIMKTKSEFASARCLLLLSSWMDASAAVLYVNVNSASPTPPFTDWTIAATNIQDAVDAAGPGDQIFVTNGVYQTGGRAVGTNLLLNRVALTKPLMVQSVNGPEVTIIPGNGGRCAYLANGAGLSGFTVTNGATLGFDYLHTDDASGGGVCCQSTNATVSNCVMVGNSAFHGGGAWQGTLANCRLVNNSAYEGGGAWGSTLSNCALQGNSANYGGGAGGSTLNNCTLTANSAQDGVDPTGDGLLGEGFGGGAFECVLNNSTLVGNSASGSSFIDDGSLFIGGQGGGADSSTLNNCTLVGNSAVLGGGVALGRMNNCICLWNTADIGSNYSEHHLNGIAPPPPPPPLAGKPPAPPSPRDALNFCCTTPLPTSGVGNFTNSPLFVDPANGDFRLQPDSPCINAGNNDYVSASTDLDGNPRISGGIVDVGAYEFVFTPAMSFARLIPLVQQADLNAKRKQPLLATLKAAITSFEGGNLTACMNQLSAFQNKVRAQIEPANPALSAGLVQAAQQIIDALKQ